MNKLLRTLTLIAFLFPAAAQAQTLHNHTQLASYPNQDAWLQGSAQGHWFIEGDINTPGDFAHVHVDFKGPYLGEFQTGDVITCPFTILLHRFPGRVRTVEAGWHSLNDGVITWDVTGNSTQPEMVGNPTGDVSWTGHFTVTMTSRIFEWWPLQITVKTDFDNGDGLQVEHLMSVWSKNPLPVGDALQSFKPFLGSRVAVFSAAKPEAQYGTLTVEYTEPQFPLLPFDQTYPLNMQFYSYTQHNMTEPMTNQVRADLDLHHNVPGQILFSLTTLEDHGMTFELNPALLGEGTHKLALMRTEPNDDEAAAALYVASVKIGPGVPPPTCQDPTALNFGGPLPCVYPTEEWVPITPTFQQQKVNGVLQNNYKICTPTGCKVIQ
jgi:hypothetical protein